MKFIHFPMVKFAVCFAAGILLAYRFEITIPKPFFILIGIVLILLLLWVLRRNRLFPNPVFGSITYLFFMLFGCINYQINIPENSRDHYTNSPCFNSHHSIQIKVIQSLKSDNYNDYYITKVIGIDGIHYSGKLLVAIKKDRTQKKLQPDKELLVRAQITRIPAPLNPDQFNYSNYMQQLDVYGQISIVTNDIILQQEGTTTLQGFAIQIRNNIIQKLKKSSISKEERSILQALVLGDKTEISKKAMNQYAAAGAVHMLAVSGLHVGVFYIIVGWLFSFIKYNKHGLLIHSLLLIVCLWGFAFITGLSPSVTRAVTMFSCFSFATLIGRRTNTINTLFISLIILLLYHPKWLFSVGFQLSYLAVFFIVWLQPIFKKWYAPHTHWKRTLYQIITVSISAQIGTLPLSLYYFHQFPGLFLITNIILLPLLGFIIGLSFFVTILVYIDILFEWLATTYSFLIKTMNHVIALIANQDFFLITHISFAGYTVVAIYFSVFLWIVVLQKYSYKRLFFALTSCSILIIVSILTENGIQQDRLIIFQKNKESLLGVQSHKQLVLLCNDTTLPLQNTYPIASFTVKNSIDSIVEVPIPNYFIYDSKAIVVIDSSGVYPSLNNHPIVLLKQSPRLHLDRLIDSLQPSQIIADGSNYTNYIQRWKKTCKKRKLPFHHTGTEGAFIISDTRLK